MLYFSPYAYKSSSVNILWIFSYFTTGILPKRGIPIILILYNHCVTISPRLTAVSIHLWLRYLSSFFFIESIFFYLVPNYLIKSSHRCICLLSGLLVTTQQLQGLTCSLWTLQPFQLREVCAFGILRSNRSRYCILKLPSFEYALVEKIVKGRAMREIW